MIAPPKPCAPYSDRSLGIATETRPYDAFGVMLGSSGIHRGLFGFAGEHGYQCAVIFH